MAERKLKRATWKYKEYTLAASNLAEKGKLAAYDQSEGKVVPAATGANEADHFALGFFAETKASSGSDQTITVEHFKEVEIVWFKNDVTNPVTANDIGKDVYAVDGETVSISSATSTRSVCGRARAIDTTLGVAVEAK